MVEQDSNEPSSAPAAPAPAVRDHEGEEVRQLASAADQPPAPLRLARSLVEADRRSLVYVDETGQVRSPLRYYLLSGIAYGGALSVAIAGALIYGTLFGPAWGLLTGALFGAMLGVTAVRRRRMDRVAALVVDGRLVEAERLCRRTLDGVLVPRGLRASAHHNLGAIATRRGRFDEALAQVRASMKLRPPGLRKNLYRHLLAYAEIGLLVNLGRVGEARGRLETRGRAPDGDYLRLLHWTAELTVQFGEGRCEVDEDELWMRSRRALEVASAPQLLALCSWASAELHDDDMSDHLLSQALERMTPDTVAAFPSLWAWVESRRTRLPKALLESADP